MFYAYGKTGNKKYREIFGLNFEDFAIGQIFHHRPGITISQQDNKNEATETLNNAMVHYDQIYASKTEWQQCLGVSTMTLQKVLGATWKTFYKKAGFKILHNISMTHPVFDKDTLYAKSIIKGVNRGSNKDIGEVEILTEAINQNGTIIAKIHYTLLIYKKDYYPEDQDMQHLLEYVTNDKFLAYHTNKAGEMTEQCGLYYEDLDIGEVYEHRPAKTFFESENWQHATHSLDWHPRYTNFEYMKRYHNGNKLVNDHYLLGAVTALTTRTFDRVVANLGWTDTCIHEPVYVNDTIYVSSTIVDKRESHSRPTQGIISVKSSAVNQHNEEVLTFKRTFLIYKRGLGPYSAAGY
ncbi:MaoC/PaaZ C-terminal domain-containing protein [Cysteiniphilum halobium]|uniref:MaoC/PaaZ C-terminal domain-containing protein n=1 Tax=Cysteiniphilum halobium TaxID=2219059 RepID=UPI003F8370DF